MTTPDWKDLAAAYVLDALDPAEVEAFEARLAEDAELREEVRVQRELLVAVAASSPQREAPAGLKNRILARARSTSAMGATPADEERTRAPSTRGAESFIRPMGREDRPESEDTDGRFARRAGWIVALAASLAAVALGIQNRQLADRSDGLQEQLADTRSTMEDVRAVLAQRDSILSSFLGPDVRTAALASTGAAPSARVFWNAQTGSVVLAAFDLPPAPEGRIYQLWGIADGENPVSLGTFQTEANGTAIVQRAAPADAQFAVGAVTEEPAGGSPQPTSAPFLVGSWTGE